MKCLYILNSAQIGGGNRSMLTLWDGIRALGIQSRAVCPGEGPMAEAVRAAGVPCEIYRYEEPSLKQPLLTWRNYRTWNRLIRESGASLVHANSLDAARSIMMSARRRSVPVVCHVRYGCEPGYADWVFSRLPRPEVFVFNSEALRDEVWPSLSRVAKSSACKVVHNAVNTGVFSPPAEDRQRPPRIGIVANFMPVKGHEDFLRMAAEVSRAETSAEFWLVGDDIHGTGRRQELCSLAKDLGLEASVRFAGHVSNVSEVLKDFRVLVCSSRVEPFGRSIIEAMACGTPVVATSVGGIPEIVTDGKTGFLVPPGDARAMADRVLKLFRDRELWRFLSRAGVDEVARRFSMEAHAHAVRDIYAELLWDTGARA